MSEDFPWEEFSELEIERNELKARLAAAESQLADMTRWLTRSTEMRVELQKERDAARAECGRLRNALQSIAEREGFTQLAECCVNHTCAHHYEDGERLANCAFQWGVARGYNECARTAKDALAEPAAGKKEKGDG